MSTFEHPALIDNISASLTKFRTSQSQAMQGFSQLAKAAMATASVSEKHKELMAVCIYMGGGPALMYTAETLAAWDAFAPALQKIY